MSSTMAPSQFQISEKSLQAIEWPRLLQLIEEDVASSTGRDQLARLRPGAIDRAEADRRSRAVVELNRLYSQSQLELPSPTSGADLLRLLSRVERSGAIDVEELVDLIRTHRGAQSTYQFLRRYCGEAPQLREIFEGLDMLEDWAAQIFPLIDAHGDIADSASEDLRALRFLARELKAKIEKRLEEYLHKRDFADYLQDTYVTVREGRYVLPIKANFKGRLDGIIHDVSHSEQTVFLEPQEIVEWNNQLKVTEREIDFEIENILRDAVAKTIPHVEAFATNVELMALGDVLSAIASLTRRWVASEVTVAEWRGDRIAVKNIRHPLLLVDGKVVANTVDWDRGLIVTGPNTGGKTVLLKAIGLCVCMASVGIPIPCEAMVIPESLDRIEAVIGDEQDLSQHLSTFSAHLKHLGELIAAAAPQTLLLVDEIATGTSPEEGQPLAQATIEELLAKDAYVLVTTHYTSLKHFAMSDDRCRIAAMAFDSQTRKPTYRLILDVPGESSAIDTAEALGFPINVVRRARSLRGEVSEDFKVAVRKLEEARAKLDVKEDELVRATKSLEAAQKRSEQRERELQGKIKSAVDAEAKSILNDLRELREELSKSVKGASKEDLSGGGTKLFTQISDASEKLRSVQTQNLEEVVVVPVEIAPNVGDLVEIMGLGLGTVAEVPKDFESNAKAMVAVQVGDIKTRVSKTRLSKPSANKKANFSAQKSAVQAAQERKQAKSFLISDKESRGEPLASGSYLCDVRGKTVPEALARVEKSINDLTSDESFPTLTIIHGHGYAKLKDAIRSYLEKERHDVKFRSGSWPGEGGDGVTVVERVS
ncbi:MAG TPA: Smr/MutS family protein [Bdellovibrionota bacterium]|nr:Smr/MutS family protein [Bdellovibrionota bacterium]